MKDYTPASPELRWIYDRLQERIATGRGAWKTDVEQNTHRAGWYGIDAVFRAIPGVREQVGRVTEEEVFNAGIELLGKPYAIKKEMLRAHSRAQFVTQLRARLVTVLCANHHYTEASGGDRIVDSRYYHDDSVEWNSKAHSISQRLDNCLETLNFRQREILRLSYGVPPAGYEADQEYSNVEIAKIFKISVTMVMNVKSEALKRLGAEPRRRFLEDIANSVFDAGLRTPAQIMRQVQEVASARQLSEAQEKRKRCVNRQ